MTFPRNATGLTRTLTPYGDNRIRTGDPLLAKQVLYQLSYVPIGGQWSGISGQEKEPILTTGH